MKICVIDIENLPAKWYAFQAGKTVLSYKQLDRAHTRHHMICLSYSWLDENEVHTVAYDRATGSCENIIEEFDKIAIEADYILGKNSDNFDIKHINTYRMFYGRPGMPELRQKCVDLEKEMRKYFFLISYSLDYLSSELGLGGKDRMELGDWIAISDMLDMDKLSAAEAASKGFLGNDLEQFNHLVSDVFFRKPLEELLAAGEAALDKMITYNKKDVRDTKELWQYCEEHFESKIRPPMDLSGEPQCKVCGSKDLHRRGKVFGGGYSYQQFRCAQCLHYAGRARIMKDNKLGKIL